MKFSDTHGNVHVHLVDRPAVMLEFFERSNCVDKHNQAHRHKLALERKWDAQDLQFTLYATLIRMTTTDC